MCGLVGFIDLRHERPAERAVLERMTDSLTHRGPDSAGYFVEGEVGLGFRRLSIIDLAGGDQPLTNEDGSLVLICNGEIYNYLNLRAELTSKGHTFRTKTDVEVLLHLYEEEGTEFLDRLNGQFSFAIYDRKKRSLFLARDHFGVTPLYFTVADQVFIFASEIKALLRHPLTRREVDLTGLDQIISFPGVVSPRTMFEGVESLPGGHCLTVSSSGVARREYWDLDYPTDGAVAYDKPESFYVEGLRDLFEQAVKYRLQSDVPVGYYLSGGMDSSMIGAQIKRASGGDGRDSFSIAFAEKDICESRYQRVMAEYAGSRHHEIVFDWTQISERLPAMIRHCECPVKETFNTCSLALSEAARRAGIPVVLAGEGADELFAGYVGYRFDRLGLRGEKKYDYETIMEDELRERLWGDRDLFYETDQFPLRDVKAALYSEQLNERFEQFECVNFPPVNKERLRGRHFVHQRSYLDFKLRLSDHLLTEHGDHMALANSVEARYPFLDIDLVEFSRLIPPDLKLRGYTEKYILRRVAEDLLPEEIVRREKFGFRAPGSPYLLRQNIEWVGDLLAPERIRRQGYFNPAVVEQLKRQYTRPGATLHPHLETDLLLLVLTFGLFLDEFEMPYLN
jgi:asparagine synthase (glutamine-hydrolysing)